VASSWAAEVILHVVGWARASGRYYFTCLMIVHSLSFSSFSSHELKRKNKPASVLLQSISTASAWHAHAQILASTAATHLA
jgi:hypothetical protein